MNKEGILYTGVPSREELEAAPGVPSHERMKRGRVACIECVQCIPCNPCEGACRFGAITIGTDITSLPHLNQEKCTGCGLCVAACPGLAITLIDKSCGQGEATIDFPFEYYPLPQKGDLVEAVNRFGETVCEGMILEVKTLKAYRGTAVIRMAIPEAWADEVRSMRRLDCGKGET